MPTKMIAYDAAPTHLVIEIEMEVEIVKQKIKKSKLSEMLPRGLKMTQLTTTVTV
jgi:hypothetical protein